MLLKAESEYHDFHQFFMREGTFALYLKGVAMQIIEDKVYAFSKDNPPCYTARPGEVMVFKSLDCFSGRLTDETVTMRDMDFSYNITNPAAGPVYVEGAEVGDVLVVDIYDIQVADEGTIATDDHCGPLFEGTEYRTKKIKIEDGMADFNGVRFPINPMIGVIGTAPTGDDVIDGYVGTHGGNMDNHLITKGTRLYFPVRVPGALLQMGDVHAAMGDGELCGTGIEIAAEITVRVSVLKNFELHWPVLETFGPDTARFSLMSQYTPCRPMERKALNRRLSTFEYNWVRDIAQGLGFSGFGQERSSAREEYTPPFDLTGV